MLKRITVAALVGIVCLAQSVRGDELHNDDQVVVECLTTKGDLQIVVKPSWSPKGAERFLSLVRDRYFDEEVPLFRCVKDFLCQFGYLPNKASNETTIDDDPVQKDVLPFKRGYVSFAGSGPNSRSSHLFITLGENVESLGKQPWETPIGYVLPESMDQVVSEFQTAYGDMPPFGTGPDPNLIQTQGMEYLDENFPDLDYIVDCRVAGEEKEENYDDYDEEDDEEDEL